MVGSGARKTARLVDMPLQPVWHDIAATVALAFLAVLVTLVTGLVMPGSWATNGLDLFMPSLLSLLVVVVAIIVALRLVNRVLVRRVFESLTRQAEKMNRRRLAGSRLRPRPPAAAAPAPRSRRGRDLGRRGQIFTRAGRPPSRSKP